MTTQTELATQVAATLEVTNHNDALWLQKLVTRLWEESDSSWRSGDSRFTRDVVNSLSHLAEACAIKAAQLRPVDTSRNPFEL